MLTWLYFFSEFNPSTRKRMKPSLSISGEIRNFYKHNFLSMHRSAEIFTPNSSSRHTPLGLREACKQWQVLMFLSGIQSFMSSFQLVPKSSAIVPGTVNVESIAINKDHVGMARFPSSEDEDFQTICGHLDYMVRMAPQKIAEKWRLEGDMKVCHYAIRKMCF